MARRKTKPPPPPPYPRLGSSRLAYRGLPRDGWRDAYHVLLTMPLIAFFAVMAGLVKPGGRMVLNEFHPVERKLFMAPSRDYFNAEVVMGGVPDPTGEGRSLGQCALRLWTLGEIVTAVIGAGFVVERLEELPSWTDPTIPGMFTLVASKSPA